MKQDKDAKREIGQTKYINVDWMYEQTKKHKQCNKK